MSDEQLYNLQYPPNPRLVHIHPRAEKTKWLIKHTTTTTKVKIDHTKRQLLTHRAPPEPPESNYKLLSGSEGLIGPPLPHLNHKDVPVIELLLYNWCNQYQCTAKDKEI